MDDYDNINLVGAELEGRWDEMPPVGELDYDGSVKFEVTQRVEIAPDEFERRTRRRTGDGRLGESINPDGPLIGEAVSDPLRPEPLLDWVDNNYPDHVNRTCGLHVHVSVHPTHYQWLMDEDFYEYSMERLRRFGDQNPVPDRYFNRLRGNNDTCLDNWDPDRQIMGGHDTRYRIWNFHAFRAHGTIECRVFPCYEEPKLTKDSILLVCDILCSFIDLYEPEPVVFGVDPSPMESEQLTL